MVDRVAGTMEPTQGTGVVVAGVVEPQKVHWRQPRGPLWRLVSAPEVPEVLPRPILREATTGVSAGIRHFQP